MGTLPLQPSVQRPPAPSLQLRPHPHPLHLLAQISGIHLCLSPHILPSFRLHPSCLITTAHRFTVGPYLATPLSRKSTPLTKSSYSSMECRRSSFLPPCRTDRFSLWQPLRPHFPPGNSSFLNQKVPNPWLLYPPHGPDIR